MSRGLGLFRYLKLRFMMPVRYVSTPTEPMTLPRGVAWRSGRNTRKCTMRPRRTAISIARMNAGQKATLPSPRSTTTGMFNQSVGRMSNHGKTSLPVRRSDT